MFLPILVFLVFGVPAGTESPHSRTERSKADLVGVRTLVNLDHLVVGVLNLNGLQLLHKHPYGLLSLPLIIYVEVEVVAEVHGLVVFPEEPLEDVHHFRAAVMGIPLY